MCLNTGLVGLFDLALTRKNQFGTAGCHLYNLASLILVVCFHFCDLFIYLLERASSPEPNSVI